MKLDPNVVYLLLEVKNHKVISTQAVTGFKVMPPDVPSYLGSELKFIIPWAQPHNLAAVLMEAADNSWEICAAYSERHGWFFPEHIQHIWLKRKISR